MSWVLETEPNKVAAVLRTSIREVRVVNLAEPGGAGFDMMKMLEAIGQGRVSSVGEFLRRSATAGKAAGVHRQYELQIRDHLLPYVSVYERCQQKYVAVFRWSSDTEPLHSGDERIQLLACKLAEPLYEQAQRVHLTRHHASSPPTGRGAMTSTRRHKMKNTRKYVIFRESRNDFLCESLEGPDMKLTGWHPHPQQARRYDSRKEAKRAAQDLASRKGCKLTVCELAESETQIAVKKPLEVRPFGDW